MRLQPSPELLNNLGDRITQAKASQTEYDRHVAPIVDWARAQFGEAARETVRQLMYDDGTSDTALELLRRAYVVLSC